MHRRAFIRLLSGLLVAVEPITASAQATSIVRRIGYLAFGVTDPPEDIEQQYAP